MAGSYRSNNVYYASKKPLNLSGLREGRKQTRKATSYVHRPNDIGSASTKYYAAAQPKPVEPQAVSVRPTIKKLVTIENKKTAKTALPAVVAAFSDGATEVVVCGNRNLVNQLRTSVELAVGRNTLTRAQADSVSFKVLLETAPKKEKPANVAEEPVIEVPGKVEVPNVTPLYAEPVETAEAVEPPPELVDEADIAKLFQKDNYESDD